MNRVPVSSVVTTMFAASQSMMVLPKPIVRSAASSAPTLSCPNREMMRCNMTLLSFFRHEKSTETHAATKHSYL